jgi:hypothetical protein
MAAFPVPSRAPRVQASRIRSSPNESDTLDRLHLQGAPHGIIGPAAGARCMAVETVQWHGAKARAAIRVTRSG